MNPLLVRHRSLFNLRVHPDRAVLKKECIKRQYPVRARALPGVFGCIEMFHNPTRGHGSAGSPPPIEFEGAR